MCSVLVGHEPRSPSWTEKTWWREASGSPRRAELGSGNRPANLWLRLSLRVDRAEKSERQTGATPAATLCRRAVESPDTIVSTARRFWIARTRGGPTANGNECSREEGAKA